MRIDRLVSLYAVHPFIRKSDAKAIPILMYHSISDDPEKGISPYYKIATSPKRFWEQMQWLSQHHYRVIGLQEVQDILKRKKTIYDKAVVITFDDGYLDVLTNAWPVLDHFGYTATVFLPTDFIGDQSKSFKGRACLAWKDVRQLHSSGISFGSHTMTHPVLYRLNWTKIRNELCWSRFRIEEMLQEPIVAFGYPFAFPQEDQRFTSRFKMELKHAGYRIAVTTIIGRVNTISDSLCMPRLPINNGDNIHFFKAKIQGAYDLTAYAQKFIRYCKMLFRSTGSVFN